jgi:hypothetical protein
MRNARCRDGTGSPPRPRQEGPGPRRERGTVTGEPSALKGACWVRREAARKRPAPIRVRDLAAQPTLLLTSDGRGISTMVVFPGEVGRCSLCHRGETS